MLMSLCLVLAALVGLVAGESGNTYSDIMSWRHGVSIACGRANSFLEGLHVEPNQNQH